MLHHWTKQKETDEIYPFARFNRKVEVIRYTDEEYKKAVNILATQNIGGIATTSDWSKEETDHLFDLCERFSLRFIVIADRFGIDFPSNQANNDNLRKRD